MGHEARAAELGIVIPEPMAPAGNYVVAKLLGQQLHVGGHGPVEPDGTILRGKVGDAIDLPGAQHAARLTGLQLLGSVRATVGSLDRVVQVVKVFGMVNCAPGFTNTPAVINGCSDLFVEVFGDAGRHTRSAVGMAELPFGIPVEIEAIFEVTPS